MVYLLQRYRRKGGCVNNMGRILILAFLAAMAVSALYCSCSSSSSATTPTPNSVPVAIEGMDIDSLDGTEGILADSRFKYAFEDVNTATVTTSSLFIVKETDDSVSPYCDINNALSATVGCTEWSDYWICVLEATEALDCGNTYHVCMTEDIKKSDGQPVFSEVVDKTFYTASCDWSVIYGGTTCSTSGGVIPPPFASEINYTQVMDQVPYTGWTDTELECLFSEVYSTYGVDNGCLNSEEVGSVSSTCDFGPSAIVVCTTDSDCSANFTCVNNQCELPNCGSYFTTDCSALTTESGCDDAFSYDKDYAAHFRRCIWSGGTCTTTQSTDGNLNECYFSAANDRSGTAEGGGYACDYNEGSQYPCDTLFNGNCSSGYYNITYLKAHMTHIDNSAGKERAIMCASHYAAAADVAAGCFSEETFRTADDACKLFDDNSRSLCHTLYDASAYSGSISYGSYCREAAYPYYVDKWKCRGAYYYNSKGNKYNCNWSAGANLAAEPPIYVPHCEYTGTQCIQ